MLVNQNSHFADNCFMQTSLKCYFDLPIASGFQKKKLGFYLQDLNFQRKFPQSLDSRPWRSFTNTQFKTLKFNSENLKI